MANTTQHQVNLPPSVGYDVAERKRKLAEAMMAKAVAPRQMPVGPTWGYLANGLTQLGEALLARNAMKKADKAEMGADANMRDVNAEGIEKLAGAYQIEGLDGEAATPLLGGSLPGSKIDAALKGADPRQANQVIAQALLSKQMPQKDENTVLQYGAKLIGPNGQVLAANDRIAGAPATSGDMQWLQTYMEKNPEASFADAATAHAAYKRAMQPERPPDPVTPVTIARPDDPTKGRIVDARTNRSIGDAPVAAPKPADATKSQQKVAAIEAAKVALSRVQSASNTLGSGGGFIEGRLPAMGETTQDYDGAVAQLLAALQSAVRVPGIGSQSNMELQALMEALPLRKQEKKVRDNQITGIAQRLEEILSREASTEQQAGSASVNAAGPLTPAEQAELDSLRKRFGK